MAIFKVNKTASYTVNDNHINMFKGAVVKLLNEEDEEENFKIEDISDNIVCEVLQDLIQKSFQACCPSNRGDTGVIFDDYFETISFDFCEEDVIDTVYEAAALVRDGDSDTNVSESTENTSHFVVVNDWADPDASGFDILMVAHSYEEALTFFNERILKEKEFSKESNYEDVDESEGYYDSCIAEGFYSNNHNKLYIQEV
jgi:hypothetical protein